MGYLCILNSIFSAKIFDMLKKIPNFGLLNIIRFYIIKTFSLQHIFSTSNKFLICKVCLFTKILICNPVVDVINNAAQKSFILFKGDIDVNV